MKKTSIALCLIALIAFFTACEQKGGNIKITASTESFATLEFATSVTITGTISGASELYFTSVKASGGSYTALGEAQRCAINSGAYTMNFFVDDNALTHIEIKGVSGDASNSIYIAVGSVTGEPRGSAVLTGNIVMMADSIVPDNTNTPSLIASRGSECPSFFSMAGVEVNGTKKHVLNLNEVRNVKGENVTFYLANVLYKTTDMPNSSGDYRTRIGSQRGYTIGWVNPTHLSSGTIGRQCDTQPDANGNKIEESLIDNTMIKRVPGDWDNTRSDRDALLYALVDSVFVAIGTNANSIGSRAKAFELIELIRKRFDSITLDPMPEEPTTLGGANFERKRVNAGHTGTTISTERWRGGDYLILKVEKNGKYRYGIVQVVNMYDDSQCFMTTQDCINQGIDQSVANLNKLDKYKSESLFNQPCVFNVKMQADL